jgi:hypothetical protein
MRPWTLATISLGTLTAFVALLAAYGQVHLLPVGLRPIDLAAFDVESTGSLSRWLGSLLLVAAAFQGVQILRLRRHKMDDYRARYRLWGWLPLVFFAMAVCVATGLPGEGASAAAELIDSVRADEVAGLWPVGACLLWTLLALRLAFEIRLHRGALALLAATTLCYFAAAAGLLVVVHPLAQVALAMVRSALASAGHLALFLMVAIFGRHVYLESQGLLQGRRSKKRKQPATPVSASKSAVPQQRSRKSAKSQEPQTSAATEPPESGTDQAPDVISMETARRTESTGTAPAETAQAEQEPDTAGLSKAERRRLRKQKRRERRAA